MTRVPENIVQLCSFENISGLEVNKTGKHREGQGNLRMENNIFFQKGKVGDWKNYLTTEMAQRLDEQTMQKLSGSDLRLPLVVRFSPVRFSWGLKLTVLLFGSAFQCSEN
ncbi:hypothetical protein J1N35_028155 [Gossypium stocksii]|uniref:Sulfotransferase n=1 Tax=Gossypium stocksii TaxID=47602 RepID=A0A9D3UVM2_9ROSI|nr:hypothetical protein J1N35_028155 [Gossypium stocksii]